MVRHYSGIGVAVLCRNHPELMNATLEQLGDNITVIDNGSSPRLKSKQRMMYIASPLTFTAAWNRAMRFFYQSGYQWVWMLNNDLQGLSEATFNALYNVALESPDFVAGISPAYNSPHQHMHPQGKDLREVNWLDFAGPFISTYWFCKATNGFDEAFEGYGCDLDWCLRVKRQGGTFLVDDRHPFHHLGGLTEDDGHHRDVAHMNRVFKEKYGVNDWTGVLGLF